MFSHKCFLENRPFFGGKKLRKPSHFPMFSIDLENELKTFSDVWYAQKITNMFCIIQNIYNMYIV